MAPDDPKHWTELFRLLPRVPVYVPLITAACCAAVLFMPKETADALHLQVFRSAFERWISLAWVISTIWLLSVITHISVTGIVSRLRGRQQRQQEAQYYRETIMSMSRDELAILFHALEQDTPTFEAMMLDHGAKLLQVKGFAQQVGLTTTYSMQFMIPARAWRYMQDNHALVIAAAERFRPVENENTG